MTGMLVVFLAQNKRLLGRNGEKLAFWELSQGCLPFIATCVIVSLDPASQKGEGDEGALTEVGLR